MLEEYVVANCIYERAQTIRLTQAPVFAQHGKHPRKGLLAHVFSRLWRLEARTKFQVKQRSEVANKMLLCPLFSGTQTFNVSCIECMKLQNRLRGPEWTQV